MAKKKITGDDGKEYTVKEKKPFYKRWWFIGLVVLFIFGAIGSMVDDEDDGPQKVEDDTEEVEDVSTEEPDETTEGETEEEVIENTKFGIGEKVELEGQIVEVTDVEYSNGSDFDKPSEGNEYVIVHVSIENNGDEEISYNPFNFKMKNSNGQIESMGLITVDSDTSLSSGELAEGGNVSGTLSFEQPIDDEGLELIFEPSFWSTGKITFNLQK